MADRPSDLRSRITPRLVFGVFLLALGTLFLLDRLQVLDARGAVHLLWPIGFIALGLTLLLQGWCGRRSGWGVVWIVAGTWLLLDDLGLTKIGFWRVFWPGVLVLVGAALVWRALSGPRSAVRIGEGDAAVSLFAVMAGIEQRNSSPAFRGGDVSAVLGGSVLDLRQARLAGPEATLDVFAFWGGVEICVPEDWVVASRVLPIMGGYEDKTKPHTGETHGRLLLRGAAIMGGVEVHN